MSDKQYHLETRPGDLAARCILVGSPERAEMIASDMLSDAVKVGDHRGLKSFTGRYAAKRCDIPVSVVTTGMGSASTAIVLPEAVLSGARMFIRVGSCGAIRPGVTVGDAAICTAAVRLDGASENWAPIEYPAFAHHRVVAALENAARDANVPHHLGVGVTTTCFNEGQSRPDPLREDVFLPSRRIVLLHNELRERGALFYSMEEATIFVWCATHGGYPCGAVDAVYVNRNDGEAPRPEGDTDAALIALEAFGELDPLTLVPSRLI